MLSMIFGEMVPKTLALRYPTGAALVTVLPMQWSSKLFAWSIVLLNRSAVLLL